ncbi:MAG TPA: FAD-dependent oxidoreductase, partial [Bacteroidales bacterium]|nr:FAD-dependent oxidoreductase [Bacteroidales bacterium]
PAIDEIVIPSTISDNITLSTMHGCPAGEIEDIARYLLEQQKLHTLVKLNPTLLGHDELRDILNSKLHFKTSVPDEAFEHDLKYPDAVRIIRSLQKVSKENGLQFGLKLTNTLETLNDRRVFDNDVDMMYMSGRALHPVAVNVAAKLQREFGGELLLSFSAGASAFNISDLLSCGFKTVTVCTDLLKPGGYMRLNQYFGQLEKNKDYTAVSDRSAALSNLSKYAVEVLHSDAYRRDCLRTPDIKTERGLGSFDCISAPCRDTCSANQDVPDYLWFASTGHFDMAYEVILRTNPFPSVTGMVCDHLCQGKCTRVNYDHALKIREVKRFISEQDEMKLKPAAANGLKAAVIGAGPSGLSCAYYLRLAGFSVDVFESKPAAGGMVRFAIPGFRLTDDAVERDIKRITDLGVDIRYNSRVDRKAFESLKKDYQYIFVGVGAGAQLSTPLQIEDATTTGVIEPLEFLFDVRKSKVTAIGKDVVIIGGGNTAMDAARTAWRLVGDTGRVTVVYRRTINEMPADQGEIKAVMDEGVEIIELTAPEKVLENNGRVRALLCSRMELQGADDRGRPMPVKIKDSEFEIPCDTIIPAIGQRTDIAFASAEDLAADRDTYKTRLEKIFIGGDAMRGASTAINAIGDGRKAAAQIIDDAGIRFSIEIPAGRKNITKRELMIKRAVRLPALQNVEQQRDNRRSFMLVSETMDRETVVREADRCLWCDEICNICTTVCPNFANHGYEITPVRYNLQKAVMSEKGVIEISDDKVFEIKQRYQILNIANYCNECGNCNTFCPSAGAPYKEKPRFYLTISSFNQAEEGYYLANLKNRKNLIFKQKDHITTLTALPDEYIYENDYVVGRFTREEFRLLEAEFKTPCVKEVHFTLAAEMSVLLRGAEDLVFE